MGKLKAALMAKTMDDMGPDEYPDLDFGLNQKPSDSELKIGFTMNDLANAVKTIEDDPKAFKGEYHELDTLTARMQAIVAKLDK